MFEHWSMFEAWKLHVGSLKHAAGIEELGEMGKGWTTSIHRNWFSNVVFNFP